MALDAGDVVVRVSPGRWHGVRLEVTDCGPGVPEVVDQDAWDPSGHRGLQIVDQIAADWGVERQGGQKVVWCELPTSTRSRAGVPSPAVTASGQAKVSTPRLSLPSCMSVSAACTSSGL